MVFYEQRRHPSSSVGGSGLRIAIVVRNWWFPGSADPDAAQTEYLTSAAAAVDRLVASGHTVEAVVHSDGPTVRGDDRTATATLIRLTTTDIPLRSVCDAASPVEAAETYAEYDLVISVRMHAALLALRVGTAALAIGYEAKTREIFGQLGLADWAIEIDDFSAEDLVSRATSPFPHAAVTARWSELHDELRRDLSTEDLS
jgi:polysaccharide pyruvyl transferase WcaK-like protein